MPVKRPALTPIPHPLLLGMAGAKGTRDVRWNQSFRGK